MRRLLLLTALLVSCAAPAGAAVAPGRVTFVLDRAGIVPSVDPIGARMGVGLPDGGSVVVGQTRGGRLLLAQLRADGTLNPSFGAGGVAAVTFPEPAPVAPVQVLRRPDGRLLVIASGAGERLALPQAYVVALTAAGRLDTAFAGTGVLKTAMQVSCGSCSPAALTADGSLVLTGNTGEVPRSVQPGSPSDANFIWVVARFTETGDLDPSFDGDGVRELPGGGGGGYGVAPHAGGAVTVLGRAGGETRLVRLTAAGATDPGFNGGAPVVTGIAFNVTARPGGGVDVVEGIPVSTLRRFDAAGAVEITRPLGPGNFVRELLPAPDGSLVVASAGLGASNAVALSRVSSRHEVTGAAATIPIGGTGFYPGRPFLRADGGVYVPGAAAVVQYTGEGVGNLVEQAAMAAFTPAFALDTTFGGPLRPASLTIRVAPQRLRTANATRTLRLIARTSGPASCRVTVTGRGRVLARRTVAAFHTGPQRIDVFRPRLDVRRYGPLTPRVRVTARCSDLLGATATAAAVGILR